MNRYAWEWVWSERRRTPAVFDRRRGTAEAYQPEAERAMALCTSADDAQMIVDALNARSEGKT